MIGVPVFDSKLSPEQDPGACCSARSEALVTPLVTWAAAARHTPRFWSQEGLVNIIHGFWQAQIPGYLGSCSPPHPQILQAMPVRQEKIAETIHGSWQGHTPGNTKRI